MNNIILRWEREREREREIQDRNIFFYFFQTSKTLLLFFILLFNCFLSWICRSLMLSTVRWYFIPVFSLVLSSSPLWSIHDAPSPMSHPISIVRILQIFVKIIVFVLSPIYPPTTPSRPLSDSQTEICLAQVRRSSVLTAVQAPVIGPFRAWKPTLSLIWHKEPARSKQNAPKWGYFSFQSS